MAKMLPNLGKLSGRTVFITGASRGIGKAIALKCARDGANIVIAAKTVIPHPKLPGTIYTAAKELEEAGGKCLPCEVDIRDEDQVKNAVEAAVKQFGGIDILINNASAINLTGTEDTPMKKYDLMNGVNARGTFLCSKYCIPHLRKGKNPHILNISPPLNMTSKWFKNHVAYTMAKYGMTMCALGMSEELKADGIAVNTLWPRTAIFTAAMEMLGGGGKEVANQCRKPDIMADAAYAILLKGSKEFTGNFLIDDEVLKKEGITNFDDYSYVKGATLLNDFFLDDTENPEKFPDLKLTAFNVPQKPAAKSANSASFSDPELNKTFTAIKSLVSEDLVKSVGGFFLFDLKGAGSLYLDLKNSPGSTGIGSPPEGSKPDVTMILSKDDFVKMFAGQLNATSAFMTGKLRIKGDLGMAMKLDKLMKSTRGAKL